MEDENIAKKFRMFLRDFMKLRIDIERQNLYKPLEHHSYIELCKFFLKNLKTKVFLEKEDLDYGFNIAKFVKIAYEKTYDEKRQAVNICDNFYTRKELEEFLILLKPCKESMERYGSYLLAASPFTLALVIAIFEILERLSKFLSQEEGSNCFVILLLLLTILFLAIFFQTGLNISSKKLNYTLMEAFILKILKEGDIKDVETSDTSN